LVGCCASSNQISNLIPESSSGHPEFLIPI
jgi:hypothetical protein